MTKAVIFYKNNLFQSIEISGHSGYQESGFDIICSAVSTAVFTTLNLIDRIYGDTAYQIKENQDQGYLKFSIEENLPIIMVNNSLLIEEIIQNLICMLDSIANDYPKNFNLKIRK